jgi:hypothetical protein
MVVKLVISILAAAAVGIAGTVTIPLQSRITSPDSARLKARQAASGYNIPLTDWFSYTDCQVRILIMIKFHFKY